MLSLIIASTLFMGPAGEPAHANGASPVEFVARVTEERLVAINSSERAQLLLFGDREGGRGARAVIAAGAEITFDFPVGTLDALWMRVVSAAGPAPAQGTLSSDAYDLGELAAERFEFFWIESAGEQIHAWGMAPTGPTYLPAANEPQLTPQPTAPHVPVITPTDKPQGDLPPRIEEKPLPPV